MSYEAPHLRRVGTVADVTLAEGSTGHDDQFTYTLTFNGVTTTGGYSFGGGLS